MSHVILKDNDFGTLKWVNGVDADNCIKYQLVDPLVHDAVLRLPVNTDEPATEALGVDGEFHLVPARVNLAATNSSTVTFLPLGTYPNLTLNASVRLSDDPDNILGVQPSGLFATDRLLGFKRTNFIEMVVLPSGPLLPNEATDPVVGLSAWLTGWTKTATITNNHPSKTIQVFAQLSDLTLECINYGSGAALTVVMLKSYNGDTWVAATRAVVHQTVPTGEITTINIPTQPHLATLAPGATMTLTFAIGLNELANARNFSGSIQVMGGDIFAYGLASSAENWLG